MVLCIRIRRKGGIYGEIWPEPKGNSRGHTPETFREFRPYFALYPESSPNTDIIAFLKVYGHFQYCYTGRVDSLYIPLWEGYITLYTP